MKQIDRKSVYCPHMFTKKIMKQNDMQKRNGFDICCCETGKVAMFARIIRSMFDGAEFSMNSVKTLLS